MTGAGLRAVRAARGRCPRPLLAFAIRELGCVAGRDGDRRATTRRRTTATRSTSATAARSCRRPTPRSPRAIAAVGPLADVPRGDGWHGPRRRASSTRYLDTVAGLAGDGPRDLRHRLHAAARRRRHARSRQVLETRRLRRAARRRRSRSEPDPDFPTVAFPNPEEPGAMDLAMALAARARRRPGGRQRPGRRPVRRRGARTPHGWRMLRGDEVGALLAAPPAAPRRAPAPTPCSIVSSSLLGKIAAAAGQPYAETLTGFKWIGRVDGPGVRLRGGARLLRRPRARAGQGRRLRAAAALRARRRARRPRAAPWSTCSTTSPLDARPARHRPALGAGRPTSRRSPPRWSGCATTPPTALGGLRGRAGRRPRRGRRRRCRRPTGCATGSPSGARVIVRPSGTEPKLKCYLEVVVPVDPEAGVDAARISAAAPARRAARRHQGRRRASERPARAVRRPATTTKRDRRARPGRRSRARPAAAYDLRAELVLLLGARRDAAAARGRRRRAALIRCSTKSG